jgi:hypothetical protein
MYEQIITNDVYDDLEDNSSVFQRSVRAFWNKASSAVMVTGESLKRSPLSYTSLLIYLGVNQLHVTNKQYKRTHF